MVILKQEKHCFPIPAGDLQIPDDTRTGLIRRIGSSVHNKNKSNLPGATHGEPEAGPKAGETEEGYQPLSSHTDEPHHQAAPEDYWTMQGDLRVRHHLRPRTELFVPEESIMPFPQKYIDVTRRTRTTLESPSENPSKIIGTYLIVTVLGATPSWQTEASQISGRDRQRSFFFVILYHQDTNGC